MKSSTQDSDLMYVRQMLQDSDVWFESFYNHFYNRIFLFIAKRIKDSDISKELTNNTFLKIYLNKHTINVEQNFLSYFYSIALNELRQYCRKKKDICLEMELIDVILTDQNAYDQQEEGVVDSTKIGAIENAITHLSDEEQVVINMRFMQEKSLQEIASALQLPLGTIKSKISRAVKKIKKVATNYILDAYN